MQNSENLKKRLDKGERYALYYIIDGVSIQEAGY
jgi:hypothetical protein